MTRAQGKHRDFSLNQSVATLFLQKISVQVQENDFNPSRERTSSLATDKSNRRGQKTSVMNLGFVRCEPILSINFDQVLLVVGLLHSYKCVLEMVQFPTNFLLCPFSLKPVTKLFGANVVSLSRDLQ